VDDLFVSVSRTAGFLAYGIDKFDTSALIAVAPMPLLFWFTTTYLPLDRYGNKVLERLTKMEELAESQFSFPMYHFRDVRQTKTTETISEAFWGIIKTKIFEGDTGTTASLWSVFVQQYHRARFRIWVWVIVVTIFCGYHGVSFLRSGRPFSTKKDTVAQPVNLDLNAPLIEIVR
jgi:hypothetical protein